MSSWARTASVRVANAVLGSSTYMTGYPSAGGGSLGRYIDISNMRPALDCKVHCSARSIENGRGLLFGAAISVVRTLESEVARMITEVSWCKVNPIRIHHRHRAKHAGRRPYAATPAAALPRSQLDDSGS